MFGAFYVDMDVSRIFAGIIVTDFFDEAAIAGIAGISYDYTVERSFFGAHSFQSDLSCHG